MVLGAAFPESPKSGLIRCTQGAVRGVKLLAAREPLMGVEGKTVAVRPSCRSAWPFLMETCGSSVPAAIWVGTSRRGPGVLVCAENRVALVSKVVEERPPGSLCSVRVVSLGAALGGRHTWVLVGQSYMDAWHRLCPSLGETPGSPGLRANG